MNWDQIENSGSYQQDLQKLLRNQIPYLRVKKFIDENTVNALLRQLTSVGYDFYEAVDPPIGKIGVSVFENQLTPSRYFENSNIISSALQSKASQHGALIKRLLGHFKKVHGMDASLAFNNNGYGKNYFAGLVRIMRGGALLHIDYAPFDACMYDIAKEVLSQIACNIFLKTPDNGGDLIVYNKLWNSLDEKCKILDSYGYQESVVKHAESIRIKPEVGDLILFNSQNFHKVTPNGDLQQDRITVSCFAGETKNNRIILWS